MMVKFLRREAAKILNFFNLTSSDYRNRIIVIVHQFVGQQTILIPRFFFQEKTELVFPEGYTRITLAWSLLLWLNHNKAEFIFIWVVPYCSIFLKTSRKEVRFFDGYLEED